jgi:hypothetical protein
MNGIVTAKTTPVVKYWRKEKSQCNESDLKISGNTKSQVERIEIQVLTLQKCSFLSDAL